MQNPVNNTPISDKNTKLLRHMHPTKWYFVGTPRSSSRTFIGTPRRHFLEFRNFYLNDIGVLFTRPCTRPKEIDGKKKRILDSAQRQALIALLGIIVLLFWSRYSFNRFLTDENLETYISAAILFLFSLAVFSGIDHYIFILKLTVKDIRT